MKAHLIHGVAIGLTILLAGQLPAKPTAMPSQPKALPTFIVPEKERPLKKGEIAPAPPHRKKRAAGAKPDQNGYSVRAKHRNRSSSPALSPKK
jgi:hypothetical protein